MRKSVKNRPQHRLSASSTGWFLSCFTRTSSDEDDDGAPPQDDDDADATGGVGFTTPSAAQVAFKKLQRHQKEQRLQLLENYVEYIDHIIYLLAMLGFVIGSVFFIPQFGDIYDPTSTVGVSTYTVASLMVLYLNVNDLVEVLKASSSSSNNNNHAVVIRKSNRASGGTTQPNHTTSLDDHFEQQQQENSTKDQRLDILAAVFYIIGALLFSIAVVDIWFETVGGWLFVIGSLFLILGAFANSLQIWDSPDRTSAQMANTIVILYVMGSTMFFVASVPYVKTYDDERDNDLIYDMSSSFYLIGSILYFVNGILEIRRSQYIKKQQFFENNDDDSDDEDDSGDDDDNDASTLKQLKQATETTRTNTTADFSSALIDENN